MLKRRFARSGGIFPIIITSGLLAGCSVSLTDRTQRTLLYDSPVNSQIFAAETKPGRGNTIRAVSIDIDGKTLPLQEQSANSWIEAVEIARCRGVVSYSYTVDYEASSGPASKRFPGSGTFTRRVEGQPLDCDGSDQGAFQVNSAENAPDLNPGDGICSAGPGLDLRGNQVQQRCTLRAAIMEANATPGINSVAVPPAQYSLYDGAPVAEEPDEAIAGVGDLDITDDLIIATENFDRPGECVTSVDQVFDRAGRDYYEFLPGTPPIARIDGMGQGRVLDIHDREDGSDVRVEIDCILITGGVVVDTPDRISGAGGGILNRGSLRLNRTIIARNHSRGFGSGAGIENLGTMRIVESAFLNNGSGVGGAAVGGVSGGAIATRNGFSSISRTAFIQNYGARGGAIYAQNASVNVSNSSFNENRSGAGPRWPTELKGSGNGLDAGIAAGFGAKFRITNASFQNQLGRHFNVKETGRITVDRSIIWTEVIREPDRPFRSVCSTQGTIESLGSNYLRTEGSSCFKTARPTDIFARQFNNPFRDLSSDSFGPTLELRSIDLLLERQADGRDTPELGIYDHGARFFQSGTSIIAPCASVDQRGFARSVPAAPGRRAECDIGAYEFGAQP
ncbi:hypothetical protein [Erythrobacter sp. YT30]|uniref:hypothetical protein n=1 Tax=Erythrobacter sp. YT30 TaxID=1735012 RepID=UPI00076D5F95|nr:hypothetical protein [Erythrobacter sp. YT30]KWV92621.1 hypothetical protein AUC45_00080 [Erythrobacter sp. YT30]